MRHKAFLESNGIDAFIPDENTVQINWMYTNAIGGVRLQVPEESTEDAMVLLELKRDSGEAMIVCPNCKSEDVVFMQMSLLAGLSYLMLGAILPFKTRKVTCMKCKTIFEYKETSSQST